MSEFTHYFASYLGSCVSSQQCWGSRSACFLGLADPDPLVGGMDPDPDPDPDPSLFS